MKENLETAFNFARQAQRFKGILQIILFGSVAKGEDTHKSDIDIAIVHNLKNPEKLKSAVNEIVSDKIQVIYVTLSRLSKEIELVSALTGEGLLLFGHPLKVYLKKTELKPFVLMVYETTDLESKQRMFLNRALYGSVSESQYEGKSYKTETKGIVAQLGIQKMAKACLLANPKKAVVLRSVFKRFKVKFREELFWK